VIDPIPSTRCFCIWCYFWTFPSRINILGTLYGGSMDFSTVIIIRPHPASAYTVVPSATAYMSCWGKCNYSTGTYNSKAQSSRTLRSLPRSRPGRSNIQEVILYWAIVAFLLFVFCFGQCPFYQRESNVALPWRSIRWLLEWSWINCVIFNILQYTSFSLYNLQKWVIQPISIQDSVLITYIYYS
jgi:hypothetical protein